MPASQPAPKTIGLLVSEEDFSFDEDLRSRHKVAPLRQSVPGLEDYKVFFSLLI